MRGMCIELPSSGDLGQIRCWLCIWYYKRDTQELGTDMRMPGFKIGLLLRYNYQFIKI